MLSQFRSWLADSKRMSSVTEGLGELFVFLFFGVVAVVGSYYVKVERFE